VYFEEKSHKNFVPRTLLIDSNTNVSDKIRTGDFRQLFCEYSFIESKGVQG
jgi:hypothetical protein